MGESGLNGDEDNSKAAIQFLSDFFYTVAQVKVRHHV